MVRLDKYGKAGVGMVRDRGRHGKGWSRHGKAGVGMVRDRGRHGKGWGRHGKG